MTLDAAEIAAVIRAELVKQGWDDMQEWGVWFVVNERDWAAVDPDPIAHAILVWLRDQGAAS